MKAVYSNYTVHILDSTSETPVVVGSLLVTEQLGHLVYLLGIKEVLDLSNQTVISIEQFKNSIPELIKQKASQRKPRYSASLIKEGTHYCITFRHPLILDQSNYGKRVRKGLGIDREYAEKVHNELNELLKSPDIWGLRDTTRFNEKTLNCFYGPLDESYKSK